MSSENAYQMKYSYNPYSAIYTPAFKKQARENNKRRQMEREAQERAQKPKFKDDDPSTRVVFVFAEPHDAHMDSYRIHLHEMYKGASDGSAAIPSRIVIEEFREICPVPMSNIMGSRRSQKVVVWRQALCHALRRYSANTYPQIGRMLGGLDHSTVIHSYHRAKKAMADNDGSMHKSPKGIEFWVRTPITKNGLKDEY